MQRWRVSSFYNLTISVESIIATNLTAQDKELILSSRGLSQWPKDIGTLCHLTSLILECNDLTTFSPEIQKLTNLTVLDLRFNKIAQISTIGQLTNLTELLLSSNQIMEIPDEIGNLVNLKELQVSSNCLDSLPDSIGKLVSLESLKSWKNKLKDLPLSMSSMTCLKDLHLAYNNLNFFPKALEYLTQLNFLQLSGNKIPFLPEGFREEHPHMYIEVDLPDKIIPGLFISNREAATNIIGLKQVKISHVLTLTDGDPPFPQDFTYLQFVVNDSEDQDLRSLFEKCHTFIDDGLKSGGVLIHCNAGVSRSGTIAIAYLMKKLNLSFKKAFEIVTKVRSCVCPNSGFQKQLKQYEQELQKEVQSTTQI